MSLETTTKKKEEEGNAPNVRERALEVRLETRGNQTVGFKEGGNHIRGLDSLRKRQA